MVPINTNYRYGADELEHLWRIADADAVIFQGRFLDKADAVRTRLPRIKVWLHVDDGTAPCPPWAIPYASLAESNDRTRAPWGRSPDDLIMTYTGGTTGMPKGVMWRQDDMFCRMNAGAILSYPEDGGLDDVRRIQSERAGPIHIPAAPLMHGAGTITSLSTLAQGGRVVTLVNASFDAIEMLDAIHTERVQTIAIVGAMFGAPIVDALDANPGRWDIRSLRQVLSSGAAWATDGQEALLRHHPKVLIIDALGSSEAIGVGRALRSSQGGMLARRFAMPKTTRVLDENNRDVVPGSGQIGRVAARGRVALGYYGDPAASERTFPVIDGVRHAVTGDLATVEADGTMDLLGRNSQCINTGGEKVFAEEVEGVLLSHAAVADTVVIGIPDTRWGQAVCAAIKLKPAHEASASALIAHVKARLASYKAPKQVLFMDDLQRGANGKVNLAALKNAVTALLRTQPADTS